MEKLSKIGALIGLIWILAGCTTTPVAEEQQMTAADPELIKSHLSGTAFTTRDIDASIEFYSKYLNYQLRRRFRLDSPAGTAVFGAPDGSSLDYAAMAPLDFSRDKPYPGLNFTQINTATVSGLAQSPTRQPEAGEVVMAFAVENLARIEEMMREDGVPVVVPLAPSATGKSIVLTVLDPNGVRIQMYDYIEK